jgi:xylose isomerase
MKAMDLGVSLGAKIYVFWGGREGAEVDASKDPREAVKRFREAINYLCEYSLDQKYDLKFALEAKPNEPRGDIYFPTTGNYLGFIETLDHPEMVGVNPKSLTRRWRPQLFHAVGQAMEAGKLFHIDLNDQRPGATTRISDSDRSFDLFLPGETVGRASGYDGSRHFDAHAYRTEDLDGVKAFAAGCMRTYLISRKKASAGTRTPDSGLLSQIRREDPNWKRCVQGTVREEPTLKAKNLDGSRSRNIRSL